MAMNKNTNITVCHMLGTEQITLCVCMFNAVITLGVTITMSVLQMWKGRHEDQVSSLRSHNQEVAQMGFEPRRFQDRHGSSK